MSERTPTHPAPVADELRARIQAFTLDEPGSVFPFSARLARENGWTRAHALRVIEEYRRFVYLAMTAGHPVTPSVQVDEAWHLHLTCTRSYWDGLCAGVLGRPLHREPTRGGCAEGAKFREWYARTLGSYEAAFGAAPPPDLWPPAAERFAPPPRTRTVCLDTHWVIPRPRAPRRAAGPRDARRVHGRSALRVPAAPVRGCVDRHREHDGRRTAPQEARRRRSGRLGGQLVRRGRGLRRGGWVRRGVRRRMWWRVWRLTPLQYTEHTGGGASHKRTSSVLAGPSVSLCDAVVTPRPAPRAPSP
jgi:hypothetical protein